MEQSGIEYILESQPLSISVFATAIGTLKLTMRGKAIIGLVFVEHFDAAEMIDGSDSQSQNIEAAASWIRAFIEGSYENHTQAAPDFELAPEGTDFQKTVWRTLQSIPAGETVTYGELATRLGQPSAARAVGSAVGANPIAVLIPCHRVIRSDGALGGYAWGEENKRRLLARETLAIRA